MTHADFTTFCILLWNNFNIVKYQKTFLFGFVLNGLKSDLFSDGLPGKLCSSGSTSASCNTDQLLFYHDWTSRGRQITETTGTELDTC